MRFGNERATNLTFVMWGLSLRAQGGEVFEIFDFLARARADDIVDAPNALFYCIQFSSKDLISLDATN